ncbi:hypothetical protein ANCDUO_08239 [Ancylostoma duodenale]|uniref:Uncharacterized protein n=1 Tax=Ancylostoma duodenale TaxID=51022 RepID=A0A0C2GWJ9_9BILA|nr:hypothetical protein ANCDUO_08239 [Ancylostoma duodenale]
MEFNMRLPPTYAAQRLPQPVQRFPLHPVQAQNSALNKDPIDSFERALGGDEFDDRPPVEPIRVIKIESAEVVEPAASARKIGSNPVKTKKIIQSLTRHMNEVRRPKVIPFSNRDEIINGQIVSQPEVKVTKVEAERETEAAADMDVSSSEIANGILENILNENSFAKNASDLLRVLTNPEQTTTEANEASTSNGTEAADASIEVSTELTGSTGNDTDSSFLNFDNIDEKLNVIGSEVDDYGVDEEWEEFSGADGGSAVSRRPRPRPPGRPSTRRTTATSITSTTAARGSITIPSSGANRLTSSAVTTSGATTATITTSTTTTAPQSDRAAPELEADLDESEEELPVGEEADATTATTSASSTSSPSSASSTAAKEEDSDKSSESSENVEDDKPEVAEEDKSENVEEEKPMKKKGKKRESADEEAAPSPLRLSPLHHPMGILFPGYVCCNLQLNNLIEDTFEEIKNVQGYSACNIAKVANIIQVSVA